YRDDDVRLKAWDERLGELAGEPDALDELFAEVEQRVAAEAQHETKNQLELFGQMLSDLATGDGRREELGAGLGDDHQVMTSDGRDFRGSWEEIVQAMRDADIAFIGYSVEEFMATEARRRFSLTGVVIPTGDAESFLRGSADAGLLRIVR
ncbi:MAG TPA: hypothetical protein VH762_03020, partial [Gemmatimonadaceae bacterium]